MNDQEKNLSIEVKLNTLAQSIYREADDLGFESSDYVKLMNELLDMTMNKKISENDEQITEADDEIIVDLPIITENLIINHYDPDKDNQIVSKWFNDDDNKLFFLSTTTKHKLELESIKNDENNFFGIISTKENIKIGLLAILNVDKENGKGEMRKMIGDINFRGRGFAREATKVWLKYCTNILNLNKIYISTIETNVKNIAINRQLGFNIEGYLKKECVINKTSHDVLRMAYFKR